MNTDSQRLQIQRHLASGRTITPLIAFSKYNCLTLSQRIGEIKRAGFHVEREMVNVGEKRVARYSIPGAKR
jgi:hypothetical protein